MCQVTVGVAISVLHDQVLGSLCGFEQTIFIQFLTPIQ